MYSSLITGGKGKDNQQGSSSISTGFSEMSKSWMAGFIEGEGTFNVSFKMHPDAHLGFYPSPMFSISQHFHGKQILEMCKAMFGGIGGQVQFKPGSKTVMINNVVGMTCAYISTLISVFFTTRV